MFTTSTTPYNFIAIEIMCGIITKVGLEYSSLDLCYSNYLLSSSTRTKNLSIEN